MMKKIVVLLVVCLPAMQLFSQTLFTYGPYAVQKDEFLRAYNKNKTPVANKEQSLKEYLDLYTKFKLKVKAAQAQRLDTLQQLQYDLQNFRSQVAEGYMTDEKGLNELVDEAIQRGQKDIHVLHFYIAINAKISAADTLKAYKAMNELSDELKDGKQDYSAIVQEINEKNAGVKGADLGFITVLSLPYEIENLVYNLKPGDISRLYRNKSGLHIFKNAGERKSAGKWKVAQILFSIPPNVTGPELKAIEQKADSVYKLLKNGADFSALAKQFSEDKLTYMTGGEMPEFGTGKFELPFESKVFELKKDGDISQPIFTGYGYHIVKRLQQRDVPSEKKSDEVFLAELKKQITADTRINRVKAGFLKTIQVKTGYKRNTAIKDAELFRYADSVVATGLIGNYTLNKKTIFAFKQLNVKGADWLNFVKDYKLNRDVYKGESDSELWEKYISTTSFEYYRKHLEEYNVDFKYQMEEFKEGNMLFEIMERNVWSKAANDSTGLKKYYNEHKTSYTWAASADVILFNCGDQKVATAAVSALNSGKNWRQIAEESDGKIQSDSGRYELSQLQLPAGEVIKEGLVSAPLVNSGDNTTSFVKVLRLFPAKQQRSFEEAKGLVINDYQLYLEARWIEALRKQYPVKVNDTVLKSMLR